MNQVLQDELIAGVHNIVIWDLMVGCAVHDDVDVWVDSQGILNYVAPYIISRTALDIEWGRDLIDCWITHSPQFSKNIQVEVRSATVKTKQSIVSRITQNADGTQTVNQYSKTSFNQPVYGTTQIINTTYTSTGTVTQTVSNTSGGSAKDTTGYETESTIEKYIFVLKGLTQQQCASLAAALWRQISMHEYSVTLVLPATKAKLSNLSISSLARLHGVPYSAVNSQNSQFISNLNGTLPSTDNAFSLGQGFWPRSIQHDFSTSRGWTWTLTCVNHTPPAASV
jgi:hypothetical protein